MKTTAYDDAKGHGKRARRDKDVQWHGVTTGAA